MVEVVVGKFDSVVIKGCKLIVDGLVDVDWLVEDSVDVDFNRLVYEIVDVDLLVDGNVVVRVEIVVDLLGDVTNDKVEFLGGIVVGDVGSEFVPLKKLNGTVTINEWMRECFKLVISVHDGTVKLKIITLSIIFRPGTSSSPPMTIGAPLNFPIEPQVYLKLYSL